MRFTASNLLNATYSNTGIHLVLRVYEGSYAVPRNLYFFIVKIYSDVVTYNQ